MSSFSLFNKAVSPRKLAVTAVVIGGLLGAFLTWFAQDFERNLVFDTWQRIDARELATDEVVVVLIDDNSVKATGQWPWRRYDVARLLYKMSLAQPAAIGIDIFFTEEDRTRPRAFVDYYTNEEIESDLREQILQLPNFDDDLGNVISSKKAHSVMARVGEVASGKEADRVAFGYVEGQPPAGAMRTPNVLTSIDKFDSAAFSTGFVNGDPDKDGVLRRVPLAVIAGGRVGTGFAAELAKIKRGVETLRWDERSLVLGKSRVPSDDEGRLLFKMSRYDDAYERKIIPAIDVIKDRVPHEKLKGKVVILGVVASGTFDIVATPLGAEVPGPIVQAQAVDAILKGAWLSHPDWIKVLEITLAILLFALLLTSAITSKAWFLAPAALIGTVLPLGSYFSYKWANLLFDPARPLIVAISSGLFLLLARYAVAIQELVQQRIREAEQKKENDNARELQLRMVPSSTRLAELGQRTEIAAKLRPAKSVGGDFYDAFELENNRLLFMVGDVSGKGLRAALFMAFSKTAAKSKFLSFGTQIDKAVMALNEELSHEEDDEMDLTLLVGLIDCTNGKIEMVNAGHENPLHVQLNGDVNMVELRGGPRLRSLDGFPYQIETAQLSKGETLVMISDGATDAVNEKDELFGFARIIGTLKAQTNASAAKRVEFITKEIAAFEGKADPADDLTIFALRFVGS